MGENQSPLGKWLNKNNISQRAMASALDLNPTTVFRWANGARAPKIFYGLMIESMTGYEVATMDWLNDEQRAFVSSPPLLVPGPHDYDFKYAEPPLGTWMLRHGIGQRSIARTIGVNPTTVFRWVNGARAPKIVHALMIEVLTGYSVGLMSWMSDEQLERIAECPKIEPMLRTAAPGTLTSAKAQHIG